MVIHSPFFLYSKLQLTSHTTDACVIRYQVSALVTLYSHLGDASAAVEVLDDAVEHAQKNKVSNSLDSIN